jgi:pectate lyase
MLRASATVSLAVLALACAEPREHALAPAMHERAQEPAAAPVSGWARSSGGRGGRIVRVTTLSPTGAGSLSEALATPGPRIVVFEVGGVIDLARSRLQVREPFLTIAGQTAPSPGVTLIKGGLVIATHDVVVQHLRVRPGEASQQKGSGWDVDAISTSSGAHDVVIDHCSTTWATDENLSASGGRFNGDTPDAWRHGTSHRITFSNNLIAEGLSNSTHAKGEHSKGSLIHDNVTDVALVDNLYASNVERNPFFKGGARGIVVNNFIANPGKYAMKYTLVADEWGDHAHQLGRMSVVGNVFVPGPSTPPDVPLIFASGVGRCEVFARDNVAKTGTGTAAPTLGGALENFVAAGEPPTWPANFVARPASEVREYIRRQVGARPWDRDPIDARIVEQALAGGGAIIDSEAGVGGYPTSAETRALFVADDWNLETMTPRTEE